jgi:hypothetical protein
MVGLIGLIIFVAVVAWAAPRQGLRKYNMSPLHQAFTFTAAALGFIATGLLGLAIQKSGGLPYLHSVHMVVWSQVWVGVGCAVLAAFFWWRALPLPV